MKAIKKLIWSIRNRHAIKVVKTLFASIRKEEEAKRLHDEHELFLQVLDLSDIFDKVLPTYDGYIEYKGECVYRSDCGFNNIYDTTNAKNSAELLMWERIRAKYGSKKVDVDIIHTPYPWNTAMAHYLTSRNMMDRFKDWRLYYKVKTKKRTTKKVAKNASPKKAKSKVR